MGSKHLLEGLVKLSTREPWVDRFEEVLQDHLIPACDETGLEIDDVLATIGEELFMSMVWACAFEDFLTREFDDGENAIDSYLKRRGWKESASVRAYMAALRPSTMSLYEVSDIVPGTSFRARDLIRGGEPVLISERSATLSLRPWDHLAARVVQIGSRMQIAGGALAFNRETSEAFIEAVQELDSLSIEEKREIMEAEGLEFDEVSVSAQSPTERLRAITPMFTTFWLVDVIHRLQAPDTPELHNSEGDELMFCEAWYPLAAGATGDDIGAILQARPELRQTGTMSWSWIDLGNPAAAGSEDDEPSEQALAVETWLNGALVLGDIRLEDQSLVLSVNSRQRADRGFALLADILGLRLGPPLVKAESIEQIMASHDPGMLDPPDIPEQQQCAIIHGYMDRHYREALDLPVSMLGGETPRAAVKTDSGRSKVVEWLKTMENQAAKSADPNNPIAKYNFGWLWTELGVSDLRR
ncbi:hypothetical protein [Rhodopseudomonas palustris]